VPNNNLPQAGEALSIAQAIPLIGQAQQLESQLGLSGEPMMGFIEGARTGANPENLQQIQQLLGQQFNREQLAGLQRFSQGQSIPVPPGLRTLANIGYEADKAYGQMYPGRDIGFIWQALTGEQPMQPSASRASMGNVLAAQAGIMDPIVKFIQGLMQDPRQDNTRQGSASFIRG
jgi:hypothetical protein